jgi:hypothetical protein
MSVDSRSDIVTDIVLHIQYVSYSWYIRVNFRGKFGTVDVHTGVSQPFEL